jgi:glutamate-1-semialdehyde 2,1-aminomutase
MTVSAIPLQPVDAPSQRDASARGVQAEDWMVPTMDPANGSLPQIVQTIGARIWSADGTEYIDFDNGGGSILLGHRDPGVIAAVRMARSADERRGIDRYWADLSTLILAMMPGSQGYGVAFGADVTQVLRAALTASRRITGRDLAFACRARDTGGRRLGPQLPTFPFDDLQALEHLLDLHGDQTAALVLAPCGARDPSAGYLAGVRALADRYGAVLIFDETLSGFRVHEGGAQALYGVQADLAVFGQSLANGMPLGALVGRADLVHAARESEHLGPDIASLAAAKAVLTAIASRPVIATLRIAGSEVQAEVGKRLREAGLDAAVRLEGDPAATKLTFLTAELQSLWINECHTHRLFTLGALNMSYAHGDREIGALLSACEKAADRVALALREASSSGNGPIVRAAG